MVVMDATTLMLLFQPNSSPPNDPVTGKPLEKCKERIELLLQGLSQASIKVLIPTPVLSEILVASGPDKARILGEINNAFAFQVQPFDQAAAIEVAMLTDTDLQSQKKLTPHETKVKVKYDRQIIAIAKVSGVKTIYSDDIELGKKAVSNGIAVVKTSDLPLPPEPPQAELPLEVPVDVPAAVATAEELTVPTEQPAAAEATAEPQAPAEEPENDRTDK